ncbi:MAG TPA: UDP-N-acetylmuramoyl-L-alanine--D-glutamate ligase [Paracoccaceae bacterium]|nr:UDP-N-acetylmuramoyl-L-alanine--D-glutamate ligase [Paracoccaceae bacterium]
MIPVHAYEGQRVGVLGLGRSGLAAARALAAGGATPVCWDDGEAARAGAAEFEVADIAREREAAGLAALIVSPGVPHLYPEPHSAVARAWANGIPVDNDVGLFFGALADLEPDDDPAPKVIAVTGSNGKSTTTALIHHVLKSAGRRTQMGGNIGRGVLDLDPPRASEVMVLELSSYQTELARTLAPDVAVFLNLSPDHLDRHGGMGGYFAAKKRLFEIGAPEHAVIGIDEAEGRFLASICDDPVLISTTQRPRGEARSVFMNRHHLTEWRGKQIAVFDMQQAPALLGRHNHQNACAAWAACRAVGIAPRQIEEALASFPGLPHRMERIGLGRGVTFVNDSKATNADAAEKAIASYDRIRWIAGGKPKAGGIEPLRPLFPRIAGAYLIGEAAEEFARTLGDTPHRLCGTLDAAVSAAVADAQPGETVLLSPACASFDQFTDFEARGEAFRALVRPLLGEAAS